MDCGKLSDSDALAFVLSSFQDSILNGTYVLGKSHSTSDWPNESADTRRRTYWLRQPHSLARNACYLIWRSELQQCEIYRKSSARNGAPIKLEMGTRSSHALSWTMVVENTSEQGRVQILLRKDKRAMASLSAVLRSQKLIRMRTVISKIRWGLRHALSRKSHCEFLLTLLSCRKMSHTKSELSKKMLCVREFGLQRSYLAKSEARHMASDLMERICRDEIRVIVISISGQTVCEFMAGRTWLGRDLIAHVLAENFSLDRFYENESVQFVVGSSQILPSSRLRSFDRSKGVMHVTMVLLDLNSLRRDAFVEKLRARMAESLQVSSHDGYHDGSKKAFVERLRAKLVAIPTEDPKSQFEKMNRIEEKLVKRAGKIIRYIMNADDVIAMVDSMRHEFNVPRSLDLVAQSVSKMLLDGATVCGRSLSMASRIKDIQRSQKVLKESRDRQKLIAKRLKIRSALEASGTQKEKLEGGECGTSFVPFSCDRAMHIVTSICKNHDVKHLIVKEALTLAEMQFGSLRDDQRAFMRELILREVQEPTEE